MSSFFNSLEGRKSLVDLLSISDPDNFDMKNVKKLGLYMMCMGVDLALEHVLLERKRGDVSLETLSSLLQDLETFKKYNEM